MFKIEGLVDDIKKVSTVLKNVSVLVKMTKVLDKNDQMGKKTWANVYRKIIDFD